MSTQTESLTKRCTTCKKDKPLSQFGKNSSQKDGLHIHCKPCWNARCKTAMRSYHKSLQADTPIIYGVWSKRLERYIYVGMTSFVLEKRKAFHINQARSFPKNKIHQAINLLGEDDLEWHFLEATNDPAREGYWVKKLGTYDHAFNRTPDGKGSHRKKETA